MVALIAQCATACVQCVEARCRGRKRVWERTGVGGNICIMVYIRREWTTDIRQRICIYQYSTVFVVRYLSCHLLWYYNVVDDMKGFTNLH